MITVQRVGVASIHCRDIQNETIEVARASTERARVNIKDVGSKEFQYFKDMIMRQRDKALVSASDSQVTREVIKTEVVMIPCEYCKALMPQASIYCPSCAAPRKG